MIHDYQESPGCVSYSLEGDDSPDLLKRWGRQEEVWVGARSSSWCCLLWDSLCLFELMIPSGSCVCVCVSQSCDEGTHRDWENLRWRAAVSATGKENPKTSNKVCNLCRVLRLRARFPLFNYFCSRVTGQRWTIQNFQGFWPQSCTASETFSLETCPRFTIFTVGKWFMEDIEFIVDVFEP